jgi:hypothetical protein
MQTPTPKARSEYGFTHSRIRPNITEFKAGSSSGAIDRFRGDGIVRDVSNGCATTT